MNTEAEKQVSGVLICSHDTLRKYFTKMNRSIWWTT